MSSKERGEVGLRQGCGVSPWLCNVNMDWVVWEVNSEEEVGKTVSGFGRMCVNWELYVDLGQRKKMRCSRRGDTSGISVSLY